MFVYPDAQASDERTPIDPDEVPASLRSALAAEDHVDRYSRAGGAGIVLRLGLLVGPGTGFDRRPPEVVAALHPEDAGAALNDALRAPSGIYNVVADGSVISHDRFTDAVGWRPRHRVP